MILIHKVCQKCEKEFTISPYRINKAKFCSIKCKQESQIGEVRDVYICRKISSSSLGKIPWNKGLKKEVDNRLCPIGVKASLFHKNKPLTMEHRHRMSESHKKRWKDKETVTPVNKQIRKSIEYKIWREEVFCRDNYTCQKCKIIGSELHPHHILNFSQYKDLRFDINNGITLCKKCHTLFHITYGQNNNKKIQIEEFTHEK